MTAPVRTPAQIGMLFGQNADKIRRSLRQSAAYLAGLAEVSQRTGVPINGYTAEMLNERAFKTALQAEL